MENARKLDLRVVLGALAVVSIVAVIWAAPALAGNGSSPTSEPATGSDVATTFVQNQAPQDDGPRAPGDCPEDEGGSGGSNGDDSPSSGTGSSSDV